MSPPAIVVDDVSKRFRLYHERRNSLKEAIVKRAGSRFEDFWALREVSLEVPQGTTYGLIGHNGSGKSTMLKLMAGIHRPTSGSVAVDGRISALLELGAGFHPELSGRDNIYLNGSILGLTRKQISAAIDAIVDFSGLESRFIDSPVKVYSSGMYAKLGFSIAVNLDPEILILDEILAVGDEAFQRKCFDYLYQLKRRGTTIVFVSHGLSQVETLCDRVAWLDHGRLLAEGPAREVVDAYLDQVNEAESEERAQARAASQAHAGAGGDDPDEVDEEGGEPEVEGARRRGSREATITRVDFLDPTGSSAGTVTSGQPMTVRVHFDFHEPVEDPVFGLAVHHESGPHLAGPNSRLGGVVAGRVLGAGYVDYLLDPLPLLPGNYLVTAAIVDSSLLHVFDYRDRAYALSVRPGTSAVAPGLVELGGRWGAPQPADHDTAVVAVAAR